VAGIGMYGINYAFAMFVMYVLRFPSFMAGQALVPMGVGGVLSLLIVAAISNIVDTRITISIGLLCSAIGSWMLGYSSQVTGLEHTWFALGLLGFGTGGSIMPLTIAAFAAVKRSESGDAAAQTGLGRQIGGSFGIAIINTYIKNMSDFHRVRLQEHLTLGNQIFTQQLAGITNMMGQHGFHGVIGQRSALALLSQVLQGQAAIKAYNSGFQLVAMMFGCSVLLVFLLKAPKQVGGKDK
jgi:DHA2 family multidrug resistance protein